MARYLLNRSNRVLHVAKGWRPANTPRRRETQGEPTGGVADRQCQTLPYSPIAVVASTR